MSANKTLHYNNKTDERDQMQGAMSYFCCLLSEALKVSLGITIKTYCTRGIHLFEWHSTWLDTVEWLKFDIEQLKKSARQESSSYQNNKWTYFWLSHVLIVLKLILRPIFLDMHILNRDFKNTFAKYLSIGFYHYCMFWNLLAIAVFLVSYNPLFLMFII